MNTPHVSYFNNATEVKRYANTTLDSALEMQMVAYDLFNLCNPCWKIPQFAPHFS